MSAYWTYFLAFWAGGLVGYGLCLFIWARSLRKQRRVHLFLDGHG